MKNHYYQYEIKVKADVALAYVDVVISSKSPLNEAKLKDIGNMKLKETRKYVRNAYRGFLATKPVVNII